MDRYNRCSSILKGYEVNSDKKKKLSVALPNLPDIKAKNLGHRK